MLPFTFRCCSTIKLCFFQISLKDLSVALLITLISLFSFQGAISELLSPEISSQSLKSLFPSLNSDLVGPSGLEPPTLRLSVVRSSQLSYGPASSQTSYHSLPLSRKLIHSVAPPFRAKPASLGFVSILRRGKRYLVLVEIVGIEPATSCLQGRRSPS